MIYGNTEGIRETLLDKIEKIYDINVSKDSIFDDELLSVLSEVAPNLQREISIAIDRRGKVISISIGDSTTVEIPTIDIKEKKLSGIRIVHTHPNGISRLSALDISALIQFKLDCLVAIGIYDDKFTDVTVGFCNTDNNILSSESIGPISISDAVHYDLINKIKHIESNLKNTDIETDDSERAILVGVESEKSLEELHELAKACEVNVIGSMFQNRHKIDNAFYIGSGKVEELTYLCQAKNANLLIFDDELSGSQVRNLEDNTGVKVIDRTTLILEIFSRRARSKEAKIQVELAQMKYRIPRLTGLGTVLSRTGGGIGTRGPGEKKLETDRRHIKDRIYELNSELDKVKKKRETQRGKRTDIPKVSIVGYTNAGKSTLRNKLCEVASPKDATIKEKVFEADMLFATLDTTTRAVVLSDNRLITVTDTVGFVNKLPHDLIEAFKSTLEEVIFSDLLLHVIDVSTDDVFEQISAVEKVLKELGADTKPQILVLNKIDKSNEDNIKEIMSRYSNMPRVSISAKNNINIDILLSEIQNILPSKLVKAEFMIPYINQNINAYLHRNANILTEEYKDNGTYVIAEVDEEVYNKCSDFIINKN